MILHSCVEQVMTMCRIQEWQLSLSYLLRYFSLMVSAAISWIATRAFIQSELFPLYCFRCNVLSCNLNTLWNIILILHSYVEKVMTMCPVQEWQLSLSYFLSYFPLMVSDAISCLFHDLNAYCHIIIILYSYGKQVLTMCLVQEWQLSPLYFLSYLPLMVKATMLSILNTVRNIFMKLYGSIEEVVTMCLVANYY